MSNSVFIGNVMFTNPSDDQIKKSKELEKELENKRKILENKVHQLRFRYLYPSVNLNLLLDIQTQLYDLEEEFITLTRQIYHGVDIYPPHRPLLYFMNEIREIISEKSPNFYKISIIMSKTEIVNGYNLYDLNEKNGKIFDYQHFTKLTELFHTKNTMNKAQFMTKYWNDTCSDWAKQDECGECFAGYWKYPEDSEEYKNRFHLTKTANGEALYKLPYSHALIFETIEIGCGNRQESVRYTNFLCEVIKRKLDNKEENESKNTEEIQNKIRILPFKSEFDEV